MTSIDERIKTELESEVDLLDELVPEAVLRDISSKAVIVFVGLGILVAGIGVYCLVQFVNASELQETLRWGVWFLVCFNALVFVELWAWMQLGRLSARREIKQLELNIRRYIAAEIE